MRADLRAAIELALQAAHATPEERRQVFATDAPVADKLVPTKAAAAELECCPLTLFRYERAGKINAVRRSKRLIRWRWSDVQRIKNGGFTALDALAAVAVAFVLIQMAVAWVAR